MAFDPSSIAEEMLAKLSDADLAEVVAILEALKKEWTLNPRQQLALKYVNQVDEFMYGGAAGGGKSEFDLFHALERSKAIPGHSTLILRAVFPELKRTLIRRSQIRYLRDRTMTQAEDGTWAAARYKVADKEWHFHNGSIIEFGHCDTEGDVMTYLSAEYDLIIIDESTTFTGDQIEMLRTRLRTSEAKARLGCLPHLVLSTNPGNAGHGWHKKRYVESTNYGRDGIVEIPVDNDDPNGEQVKVAFVPSKAGDTPQLDKTYKRNLRSLTDPVKRAQYLDGSWDTFEGQFFEEWEESIHVIDPFPIPATWTKIRGIDYGTGKPFACEFIAFDWDGNAYVFTERYGAGYTATEQAHRVLEASPDEFAFTMADPSIWAKTPSGDSISTMYRKAGLVCRKATNARVDGWNVVREYLKGSLAAAHRGRHPAGAVLPDSRAGADLAAYEGPGLYIFRGHCPDLTRTLPDLLRDPKKPEDCINDPHKTEDHAPDALRYALMSRPHRPKLAKPDDRWTPGRHAEQIAKQRTRERRSHDVLGAL